MKVLLAPSSFAVLDQKPLQKLIHHGFEVIKNPFGRKLSKRDLFSLLAGVEGLISGVETLDREVLERSKLKVISRCGSGTSNIDMTAAEKLGIRIASTPDAPVEAVAELTLGMMLALIRGAFRMNESVHQGKWEKVTGVELKGKTVAVIGLGRIGRRVAELLGPFGVKILAVDPFRRKGKSQVTFVDLRDALKRADLITLHSSGEEEILGEKEFRMMKPGVFLLNAARGGLIHEQALRKALDQKIVAGAWIDCFWTEPYSGPLLRYPQVILTPHIGSYAAECRSQMEMAAVDNLIAAFRKNKS